jgi:hypothetical protein
MEFAHNPKSAMMRAGGPTDRQGQPALPGRIALAVLGTVLARR